MRLQIDDLFFIPNDFSEILEIFLYNFIAL